MARRKIAFQFSGWAFVFFALALLILPLKWVLAAMTAAVFHELCHIAAVILCGGSIMAIDVGAGGTRIHVSPMGAGKSTACALAGPAGGFLLLLLLRWMPALGICGAVHSIYNLLPLYPLDGGRALRGMAQLLPQHVSDSLCAVIEGLCAMGICIAGLWGCFGLRLGWAPLILAVATIVKSIGVKIPCKRDGKRVQ